MAEFKLPTLSTKIIDTMKKKEFESYVLSMSEEMGELTIEQFAYIEAAIRPVAYVNRKGVVHCTDCGHSWVADSCNIDNTIECPVCHRKLNIERTEKQSLHDISFINISQAWGDHWQVIRYFVVYHDWSNGKWKYADKRVYEVMQIWTSATGDVVYIARDLSMYPSRQRNPFILSRDMKIKHPNKVNNWYGFNILNIRCNTLKIFSVAKRFEYYGIKKNTNRQNAGYLLDDLLSIIQEPLAEVLFKTKKHTLLKTLVRKGFYNKDKYYGERIASLRIALSHKYLTDGQKENFYSDWVDSLENILKLGLDNRSPHYICPENFEEMHDWLVRRANNQTQAERAQERAERILSDEEMKKEYIEQRKDFFDFELKTGELTIKVLPSVEAFEKEGNEMHHCVFANEYFDVARKPDTLILSARKGDDWNNPTEVVETIEVNLREYYVVQSRGHCNMNTEYHNKIMAMVLFHMDEIKAINEERLKKESKAA